jgi:Tfp pilus assembly protein PilF
LLEGLTAAAFNHTGKAKELLISVLAKAPKSPAATQAGMALSFVYLRQGAYRKALRSVDLVLAADPEAPGVRGWRVLVAGLARHPDQQSMTRPSTAAAHVREGNIFVAVRANGQPGE